MADDPDAGLVERAKLELPYVTEAYEQLMSRYHSLVRSVCLRMLGNRADADDIAQDVMVKAFGALQGFEGRSTFKTWLMRITTNTCITAQGKRKRQRELLSLMKGEEATTSEIDTSGFDVHTLLANVNPEDRSLLVLRYIAELQFDEIAEVAELSLSATKMRIYRATEQLRTQMTEENG